mmetsp:Transcript_58/g.196  ORF Transcript_58/g.196 Transcript_58/m.196 type:complete len:366 (-) Transcript_58:381-1478(-)|eukprot:CAMPEP_0171491354 /NCGR_PEP_ID=MMETSP0958-20121227/3815_1 /TAXON_ID=87120 /ORGANISM="Aurantiochytrium limacinum, Strain ATCCMYA-1381" /LENGTH=365 /DNA_ID=CAMNT_0012024767 /DNA_START=103 /DNA_END=1200 /DNA_ORIENTATION=-
MMRGLGIQAGPVCVGELTSKLSLLTNLPKPRMARNEVLIKVQCVGIGIDEIHAAEGSFLGIISSQPRRISVESPLIPGLECCGIIEDRGSDVPAQFKVGDAVLGFQKPMDRLQGTWAEYAIIPADFCLMHKPEEQTAQEALASFFSGLVACAALDVSRPVMERAERPRILVCGASGSIGTLALQGVRHLWPNCADVFGVCSSRSASLATTAGASEVVAYDQVPEWGMDPRVRGKVDVVIDLVGGDQSETQAGHALRRGGKFVTMVGPVQFLGDKKSSMWEFFMWACKVGLKFVPRLSRHYEYNLSDVGSHMPGALTTWRALAHENVFHPRIQEAISMNDVDAVCAAIQRVRKHGNQGKVIINVVE